MIPIPGTAYLLAGAFLAGAVATYKVMDWKHDAELKRELEAAVLMERGNSRLVVKTETVVQERIVRVKERGEAVVREVPVIITKEVERACPAGLPVGFVRMHDAAARNEPAGPPAVTDADSSGTTLTAAATAVGDNYTAYHTCREQVIGWNEFYRALKARYDASDPSR